MTPKVIGMYIDVYSERQKEKYKMIEYIPWLVGKYVVDAIGCTFGKGQFPNNPLSENNNEMVNSDTENVETELTEEEKIRQTEQLFMKLRIMGANFNLNKNNKDDSE